MHESRLLNPSTLGRIRARLGSKSRRIEELSLDVTVIKTKSGKYLFVADGWVCTASGKVEEGRFGLLTDSLKEYGARGQATAIAQFYGLVVPGLILTEHIFEGLDRPLYCDKDKKGDEDKLVHTRKPAWDYEWPSGCDGSHVKVLAPADSVFVVVVSPNKNHKNGFPEIDGWIERWNWVTEDSGLPGAPIGWIDRYKKKLWTRGDK